VAKVGLQGARIVSLVGKRESARVPQHMRVSLEAQASGLASALDHAGKAGRGEGRAALRREYERRLRLLLTLQPSQDAYLVAPDRVRAARAPLGPAHC
jgi:hypothetical protein